MVVLVLLIQIVMIVFYFKFLSSDEFIFYFTDKDDSSEIRGWYILIGFSILFIIRFIYVQISYSHRWYDEIMELISLAISLLIVIPTTIYYLIKRNRKQKKK